MFVIYNCTQAYLKKKSTLRLDKILIYRQHGRKTNANHSGLGKSKSSDIDTTPSPDVPNYRIRRTNQRKNSTTVITEHGWRIPIQWLGSTGKMRSRTGAQFFSVATASSTVVPQGPEPLQRGTREKYWNSSKCLRAGCRYRAIGTRGLAGFQKQLCAWHRFIRATIELFFKAWTNREWTEWGIT